jgi:adenine deaminase
VNPAASALLTRRDSRQLMEVALGRQKADLTIINAAVLNVFTGELLKNQAVGIKGPWIAYAGEDPQPFIGPDTRVIDAAGKTLIPGLIDGHTHLAWITPVHEAVGVAMASGTTTIVTESMEAYPVAGCRGVVDFLGALADQPITILATAPPMMSISRQTAGIDPQELAALLQRDDIVGLGETYWQQVVTQPHRFLPLMHQALAAAKPLEGHSAGARGHKLAAYAATGVSSCHEPISADEVLERLRLGIHVMVREGSIRRDLAAIAPICCLGIDLRRLILVSDGIDPRELIRYGHMAYLVQKAVDQGFSPAQAVAMASLNVAEHFGLDAVVGAIAPGRQADLVLIPQPDRIAPEIVVAKGRIVWQQGRAAACPRPHRYAAASLITVQLPKILEAGDFDLPAPAGADTVKVRVIELVTDLVTREAQRDVPVIQGRVRTDPSTDLLKVAVVDRAVTPGTVFTGLVTGFGLRQGALASSAAWDTADIVVVGAAEADMALAVNRIAALQGGFVVCAGGRILAELALPVFGLISDLPLTELTQRLDRLQTAAATLGASFRDALLTLVTLTGAAIPFLRICEEGLVNLKDGATTGVIVDAGSTFQGKVTGAACSVGP